MEKKLQIKELGILKYLQWIEVTWLKEGIMISQHNHILDLLKEIGLLGCRLAYTPTKANHKLDEGLESPLIEREVLKLGRQVNLPITC